MGVKNPEEEGSRNWNSADSAGLRIRKEKETKPETRAIEGCVANGSLDRKGSAFFFFFCVPSTSTSTSTSFFLGKVFGWGKSKGGSHLGK